MSADGVYGYPCVTNPNDFTPDAECSSPEEIAAHKRACEMWGKPGAVARLRERHRDVGEGDSALISTWTGAARRGWALEGQTAAMGMSVPTVTAGGWHYLRERLFVHTCAAKACGECAAARRLGWQALRVTKDQIANGEALDAIGRLTYRKVEGGLF